MSAPVMLDEHLETLAKGEPSIDVKRRAADPMLAAKLGNGQPALRLAQHAHDLGFGETALLHRNLLVHLAEKILPSHPLNHGEDYPSATAAARPAPPPTAQQTKKPRARLPPGV